MGAQGPVQPLGPPRQLDLPLLPGKACENANRISFREPGKLALEKPKRWRKLMIQRAENRHAQVQLEQLLAQLDRERKTGYLKHSDYVRVSQQRLEQLRNIKQAANSQDKEEMSFLAGILHVGNKELNHMHATYEALYTPQASISPNAMSLYGELKDRQFRVLVLYPAPNHYHPLIGTLKTESLVSRGLTQYVTIPHYRGNDTPTDVIHILPGNISQGMVSVGDSHQFSDDYARYCHRVPIQDNLLGALLRFRRADRPVALWVDELCIDQSNPIEKTKHVALRLDIYHMSHSTCVWLGESDDEARSSMALDLIPRLVDYSILKSYMSHRKYAAHWAALGELMRDRCFSQCLVFQEVSLARRITLHCGAEVVQWSDFANAIDWLLTYKDQIKELFHFSQWRYGPDTLGDLESSGANILLDAMSRLFMRTGDGDIIKPTKSLQSLVRDLHSFDNGNPRDIIYGLVSIATDTFPFCMAYRLRTVDDLPRTILPVDYRRSVLEVYQDFTQACINSSGSLDVIFHPCLSARQLSRHCKGNNFSPKLPSWITFVPDSEFGTPDEVSGRRNNVERLVGPRGQPYYEACGSMKAERALIHELCLTVTGLQLATISDISQCHTTGIIPRESLSLLGLSDPKNCNQSAPGRIWRTLIADRDSGGEFPAEYYRRIFHSCIDSNGDINTGRPTRKCSHLTPDYLTRVRDITWNRRFFIGHAPRSPHVGLCPADARKGDLVCILFGCSVPVILRKHGRGETSSFEFIGEAYVHERMDGYGIADLAMTGEMQIRIK
ncbi:hypothetical protein FE257_008009 [Aspergillus nanangensis]|uniref:Heterokaryon incompatibility domain-containing protein n=1 Tax=Aspergillus nanangensis TaxID=2582783 RepID=A0AAD4GTT4_ASPNN|nr:hypothetical protein FE257_008009 [Aspergillus nanangensis]